MESLEDSLRELTGKFHAEFLENLLMKSQNDFLEESLEKFLDPGGFGRIPGGILGRTSRVFLKGSL